MKTICNFIFMGLACVSLSACATDAKYSKRFVGAPIETVKATMPRLGTIEGVDKKGRAYYRWNFDTEETVSVQYSHPAQTVSGALVSGGLSFGNELRYRRCNVTAYYDRPTRLTTQFDVYRSGGATCARMESYLDGSAFLPTDFPGSN